MPVVRRQAINLIGPDDQPDPAAVHEALGRLRLRVAPNEREAREIGPSTEAAIRDLQTRAGLNPTGTLTPQTIDAVRAEVDHVFFTANRVRTSRIQKMLERVGQAVDKDEVATRRFDKSTSTSLREFQKSVGLPADGRMTDEVFDRLEHAAIEARFSSKTQTAKFQRRLIHIGKIAKLDVQIDPSELKERTLGPSTADAIRSIQTKYGLSATGSLDPVTLERFNSIADSRPRPIRTLLAPASGALRGVKRTLRLNMSNEHVAGLQQNLAYLGYKVSQSEFEARTFAKSTRQAVLAFQTANRLELTGVVDAGTRSTMNALISRANPSAIAPSAPFRLRGTVRNELWQGRAGVSIQVIARTVNGDGAVLAQKATTVDGFFDVGFVPQLGAGLLPHLRVRVLDPAGVEIGSKMLFNPTPIAWANFTAGEQPYRGTSLFDRQMQAVATVLGAVAIEDLREEDPDGDRAGESQQITHVAINAALNPGDVMRLVLSHKVASSIADADLPPAAIFAFVAQNQPSNLPSNLLAATDGWTLIDQLVEQTSQGIVFLDPVLAAAAVDTATRDNLVPIGISANRVAVLASLDRVRGRFALEKPILAGNGSLQSILSNSSVPPQFHAAVANAFIANRGVSSAFWSDVRGRPADFGGQEAVTDLSETLQLGQISLNHQPTLAFMKVVLADPGHPDLASVADTAKLDRAGWIALIEENGGQVPDGFEGTPNERVEAFAASLVAKSERLYPTIAMAAEVGRSPANNLNSFAATQQVIFDNPDIDLRSVNVDTAFKDEGLAAEVRTNLKAIQRVQRISPNASIGRALLENGFHSSAQIVGAGKRAFASKLASQQIDEKTAFTMFGKAEFMYAQVIARLGDFRREIHESTPAAIPAQTYTTAELEQVFGDSPDLESLFGSQDYCDCSHCASILSPAAYLADSLRFLSKHASQRADGATVEGILLDRRPDIGNIKLNGDNTDVPLPYIDLVCEILEGAVLAPASASDFAWQTTKAASELRAFPENVRAAAYEVVRDAGYPMDSSFDLWQEEARIWLDHLGLPRHELMDRFQARPAVGTATPSGTSIAGERLGLSSRETTIVTTADVDPDQLKKFWGFDCTRPKVGVREFLDHAHLTYAQLLALLRLDWPNAAPAAGGLDVERPAAECDLDLQSVINLTPERFDRIHRFLRLWRHTRFEMWQLDRLIMAPRLGGGALIGETIVRLGQLLKLQSSLATSFDSALALVGTIDIEPHRDPSDIGKSVEPLFTRLFQNKSIMDPIDPAFAALPGGNLVDHVSALTGGLGMTESDLRLLTAETDGSLTLANLTRLLNEGVLARGLKTSVERLLTLEAITAIADPFASPTDTLGLIENHRWITGSGLDVDELDYLLRHRPDSAHGLRQETVTQTASGLRDSLRGLLGSERQARAIEGVASSFGLPSDQARVLISTITRAGSPLLDHLVAAPITDRHPDGTYVNGLDPTTLPDLFGSLRLLHKVSLLIRRQAVGSVDDLRWILEAGPTFGLLDLGALPVDGPPGASLYQAWLALCQWLDLRGRYPEPEGASLRRVFDLAGAVDAGGSPLTPMADLQMAIHDLTRWAVADIQAVHTALELSYIATQNDYLSVATYVRLEKALAAIKRLGVSGAVAARWSHRDEDTQPDVTTSSTRAAARSKYDDPTWLTTATPLMDALREKKRDALIKYLIETAIRVEPKSVTVGGKEWRNPRYWDESDDLLRFFLIDVEMGACQLTSRIKQAISSVQMFVQRCFLNIEQPEIQVSEADLSDVVSSDSWRQWRNFKNYRVAEAAKRVLIHPENWILPQLRDDKSPFFKELEDELLQSELTVDHTERAFRHYLQKVQEVSRLEVVGVYHEIDDDNPWDALPATVNVLHVVGRTRSDPAIYFYRRFDLNYGTWSAWERIDIDIVSDHLIPVVYNRRLHLFWLTFLEKPIKMKKQPPAAASSSSAAQDSPEPPKSLEIQLAWTTRVEGGWSKRQLSREKVVHPWDRPRHSYHFKPRYKARENHLWLDIFVSMSPEFNNGRVYDQFTNSFDYLTKKRFDPAARAWHSSSFVFDGAVVAVKMKPISASYHLPDNLGPFSDTLTSTNSYEYVRQDFPSARSVTPLSGPYETAPRLPVPDGMRYHATRLANASATGKVNVLEYAATQTLLNGGNAPFELIFSQDHIKFDTGTWGPEPLIYQDPFRSFFVRSHPETYRIGYSGQTGTRMRYQMYPFYHPYTSLFLRELDRAGLDRLLTRRIQQAPQSYFPTNTWAFASDYQPGPTTDVDPTAAVDLVDFSDYGAYSIYNWETFFHAPLMIACKLSADQRFEEAMRWFHFIFDPTNVEAAATPQRFWVTRPFFERSDEDYRKQRIETLLADLGSNLDQIRAWRNDPFNPHKIARYRPVAYQKTVLMKYLDNLIAWGDQLFRRDTMESINEATTLYVLAYELLGQRPVKVPSASHADKSYNELVAETGLDPLGNGSVAALIENFVAPPTMASAAPAEVPPLPSMEVLYFCIPPNDILLGYWATVEDRLFKIRHCMNISGVVRQLPLFEPPIDPALLVKAAAAGVDIGEVLDGAGGVSTQYRYRVLAAKANEFCAEVRALGDKLLSVLEKRDAEGLAVLRSTNEIELLDAAREVRKQQIAEATEAIVGFEQSRIIAETKRDYFRSREFVNANESTALTLQRVSAGIETAVAAVNILAAGLRFIPRVQVGGSGFGGSPHATADVVDGAKIADSIESGARVLQSVATALDKNASVAATMGSYDRRKEDWDFQAGQADHEIAQIERQIAGATIREAIASRELENLELQIEQSRSADDYLRTKYTNGQLYDWMLGQLSTVYFQSYKLAFDMARRAQRALQYELAKPDLSFIEFGYWDSLKKGLLAGEKLANDLHRMEAGYLDENRRELELTKHISLAQIDPAALVRLRTTGVCDVTLPEWLFDMDRPGDYRRRIKSLAVTIPAVVGQLGGVHATIALTGEGMRVNDMPGATYGDPLLANDARFTSTKPPIMVIATSGGQNDSGLFELSLGDERLLPFEGAGAVSQWRVSLPPDSNAFDTLRTPDVLFHVRYTASLSIRPLHIAAAKANLAAVLPPAGVRLFDLKSEFASEWFRFLTPGPGADQVLAFTIGREHLPFYARARNVTLSGLDLFVASPIAGSFDLAVRSPGAAAQPPAVKLDPDPTLDGVHHRHVAFNNADLLGDWTIQLRDEAAADFRSLVAENVGAAYLVVRFDAPA